MRTVISIVLALLLLIPIVSIRARAQQPIAAKESYELVGNLDYPAPKATLTRAQVWVGGWAFNAVRGGQQPHAIAVSLASFEHPLVTVPVVRVGPVPRPDVKAYFAALGYVEVSTYTGFHLVPLSPETLPLGTLVLSVELTDSYGTRYLQRPITIVE